MSIVWQPFDTMEQFMVKVFRKVGVSIGDARVCAQILIEADKRGINSHGVARLKTIYYDRIKAGKQMPVTNFEIVRKGPTTAVIDGHNGMGHVIAKKAMDMAIKKAGRYGLGMTTVRNSTHYGIAGYYVMMAASAGMIGITGTNARPSVAPTFGVENMLGTNPLTFGLPTDEDFPFVLDCATSITQRGKIENYARQGKEMAPGLVIGLDGQSRTNAQQILGDLLKGTAALCPLGGIGEDTGGYKGYGYATVVEILSASLQNGVFLRNICGTDLGHFFLAMDIEAFTELSAFKKTTGDILRGLRASTKMPGQPRIYTAGEKEHLYWLEHKYKGVPLSDATQEELRIICSEQKLRGYRF